MTTLITGGIGYVGSHTVVSLHESGRRVVVLDDFSNARRSAIGALQSLTDQNLEVVKGDAADRETVEAVFDAYGVDSVIHFAAHKSVAESMSQPLRYFTNNLLSTLTLASVSVERNVSRFVFSSSATVYGTPSVLPITEDMPLDPQSPYGATKSMCERILSDTASATDMRTVMLRYFNPVGAHPSARIGEDPLGVPQNLVPIVMQVASGRLPKLPIYGGDYDTRDGTTVRDYIHVMDLAEGHLAALDTDLGQHSSRVYNLGTGVETTVLEIVAAASEATQREIPYEIVGRRIGDIGASWADCGRAAAELGWRAHRGLSEMLADHWNFVRQHPHGLS